MLVGGAGGGGGGGGCLRCNSSDQPSAQRRKAACKNKIRITALTLTFLSAKRLRHCSPET